MARIPARNRNTPPRAPLWMLGGRDWRRLWLRRKRIPRYPVKLADVHLPVYVPGPTGEDVRRMRGDGG